MILKMDSLLFVMTLVIAMIMSALFYALALHFKTMKWNSDLPVAIHGSKRKKYVLLGTVIAAILVSILRVALLRRPVMIIRDSDVVVQIIIHAVIGAIVGIIGANVVPSVARQEKKEAEESERKAEAEKEKEFQASVLRGEWEFPYMEFYGLCKENGIPKPDGSEFTKIKLEKAVQFILDKYNIPPEAGKLHLPRGEEYYRMAEQGIRQAKQEQEKRDSTLRKYTPDAYEQQVLDGIQKVRKMHGLEKRAHMLKNQIAGLEAERNAIYADLDGNKNQPRFTYQKEKNWATWGGIADGLAGPAAGVMTAMQVQQDNQRIRQQNEAFAKANAMLDMWAKESRERMLKQCAQLRSDQEKLENELEKLPLKVVFASPDSDELQSWLTVGEGKFEKTESGILSVAVTVGCTVPEERKPVAGIVVDGTVHAKVFTNDQFVEDIYFVLPDKGIPAGGTRKTVNSLCTTALPVDGKYRLELGDNSSLWVMEK